MKKFLLILLCLFSLTLFNGCAVITTAEGTEYIGNERVYYSYYSDNYYIDNTPVILVDGIYYFQYWNPSNHMWWRLRVPHTRIHEVRHNIHHNRLLGGIWVKDHREYHHTHPHHNNHRPTPHHNQGHRPYDHRPQHPQPNHNRPNHTQPSRPQNHQQGGHYQRPIQRQQNHSTSPQRNASPRNNSHVRQGRR